MPRSEEYIRSQELYEKLLAHPIVKLVRDNGKTVVVNYVSGMWPQGVRLDYGSKCGKDEALALILKTMERHWQENAFHENGI